MHLTRGFVFVALVVAIIVGFTVSLAGAWTPTPGQSWQYQLQGPIDITVDAQVFDIDGFDTTPQTIAALHAQGDAVICYISAGSWENWRPDAHLFPPSVKGRNNGWPGEKWLDIRQRDVLRPIMAARMDMCAGKGFDAVEPDNVDGYSNRTGFPLSVADQFEYNTMLAGLAHERGLKVALKNDVEQAAALVGYFDFAINEQCAQYHECEALLPFVDAGKPVFHVEYGTNINRCLVGKALGFSSIMKRQALGAYRVVC